MFQNYIGSCPRTPDAAADRVDTLTIPMDADSNWLPDVPWSAVGIGGATTSATSANASDDVDASPGNSHNGDGLTAFEEYRGFVVLGQHRRTDPAVKELFIQNALPQPDLHAIGVGDIGALGIDVVHVETGELSSLANWVNANYPQGSTGQGYSNPAHFPQKGLKFEDGGLNGTSVGGTLQSGANLGTPSATDWSRLYVQRLRQVSPTVNNMAQVEALDAPQAAHTMAHEVGHSISLIHVPDPNDPATGIGVCPAPVNVRTVMITNYTFQSTGMDIGACAWQNIIHNYLPQELDTFRLR